MKRKILRIALAFLLILIVAGAVSGFFAYRGARAAKQAVDAIRAQDLDTAKTSLTKAKSQFEITQKSLIVFTPLRIIPILGWYVADVQRVVNSTIHGISAAQTFTEAITPYADVLGFKGQGTFLGGTAQERLSQATEAFSKISPQLDEIAVDLTKIRTEVEGIKSWRYPNIIPGRPGEKVEATQKVVRQMQTLFVDAKPLLLVLPEIMGNTGEKKYLVLFQNDAELRSTGGFITAYAIFRVENGIVTTEGSSDIYELDHTLLKKVTAPSFMLKYFPGVSNLYMRDSNFSPDFKASMIQFEELYDSAADKKIIDGIIAVDTQFVVSLMDVLGPIEAYGTKFTTDYDEQCGCPQIIHELERSADEPTNRVKNDRKDIVGVLMQTMMAKAFSAPKIVWPSLLEAMLTDLREKHMLLYFHSPQIQQAIEKINFAGRIYEYDGDYLHINESNFAGAKSNLYIQEKVKQVIKKEKDQIKKTITIDYKYPRKMDNCSLDRAGGLCLAGIYRDYIRIYVPKGSQLIKSSGAEVALTATEDLGKTVFEGFFTIRPEGTAKIELEYTVPLKVDKEYRLLIQKQPGIAGHTYEIDAFGKKQKPFSLISDKELIVKL